MTVTTGKLAGLVAVVTGGASGIGRGVVERYVADGASVVTGDIAAGFGAGELAPDSRVVQVHCDVSQEADVERLMATASDLHGGIDVLVNVAGVLPQIALVHQAKLEDWNRVLGVNLTGTFLCVKHAVPHMRSRGGGSIINTASTGAIHPSAPGVIAYSASKGAIAAMTRELVLELSPLGITVNTIAPGKIATSLMADYGEEWNEARRRAIPIGRVGQPADIAGCAAFLASADARFITGHMLVADGGVTAVVLARGTAELADWTDQ